jgi:hypothetical protein
MDKTKGLATILVFLLFLHTPVWGQGIPMVREIGAMAAAAAPVELAAEPVTVRVALLPDARAQLEAAVAPSSKTKLALTVEVMVYDIPDITYQVYIDLPKDEKPSYKSVYFVGNLAPFLPHAGVHEQRYVARFDITRNVRELRSLNVWNDADLSVTFVARGGVDRSGQQLPVHAGVRARLDSMKVAAITPQ